MNYPRLIQAPEIKAGSQVKFVKSQAELKQLNPDKVFTVETDNGTRVTVDGLTNTIHKKHLYLDGDIDPTIAIETPQDVVDESAQIDPTPFVEANSLVSDEVKPKRFKFAINSEGCDKNWDQWISTSQFENKEGDINDVIKHVTNGHALCAGLLNGNGRKKTNVIGSEWVLIDIDNTSYKLGEDGKFLKDENGSRIPFYDAKLTLEQALEHPFIKAYCSLIYTTPSHKEPWHKFRLIFILPELITEVSTIEAAISLVMAEIPGVDVSCKDACRVFYGSSSAQFPLYNPEASLPVDYPSRAVVTAESKNVASVSLKATATEKSQAAKSKIASNDLDETALVLEALNFIDPDIDYDEGYLNILMAVHSYDEGLLNDVIDWQSRAVMAENSHRVGAIPGKWKGFKNYGGVNVGTLFHYATQAGYKLPPLSSELTEWVKKQCKSKDIGSKPSWQGKKSTFLDELEYYEPTPESKSVFDWSKVKQTLPSDIRNALESQHEILGTPFHALVLSALTTLSTDLSGKAVVSVNPASDWFEGLNLWAAIVGVPGSAKSPFLGQFGKPLAILENKYTQEFKDRAKQHEIAKCEYEMNKKDMIAAGEILEELKPKRFASFGQTTTEKLITSIASNRLEHSTGFLIFLDELTGLLGAFNKRGGSDDAAVFLSSWVGGEMKKATGAGGEIFTAKSNCSILGGIQDNVWTKYLKLIAGGSDDNGFAGRWLISYLSIENITRVVIGSKSEPSRLPSVIEHYLFKFADLNDGIILHLEEDSSGQKVIDIFDAIIKTSNNPNVWIKGKSNVFRIAGLLAMLKDKRTVSTLDIEAACIIVLESIRFHEKLNGSSDEKAVSTIVDKAKAIGIKRGRLDNRTLTMAKLCESTEERQQIILKLHEEFGGTLEDARKGLKVWIPV